MFQIKNSVFRRVALMIFLSLWSSRFSTPTWAARVSPPSENALLKSCQTGGSPFIANLRRFLGEGANYLSTLKSDFLIGDAIVENQPFFVLASAIKPELLKEKFPEYDFFLRCSKIHEKVRKLYLERGPSGRTPAQKQRLRKALDDWENCLVLTYSSPIPPVLEALKSCYERGL